MADDKALLAEILRLMSEQVETLTGKLTAVEACEYVERWRQIKSLTIRFLGGTALKLERPQSFTRMTLRWRFKGFAYISISHQSA